MGEVEMTDDTLTQKLTYYEHMATEDNAVIARLRTELVEAERRIAEQDERITELYLAQKNRILSVKSTEYDIGTLQTALAEAEDRIVRYEDASVQNAAGWRERLAEAERDKDTDLARLRSDLAAARDVIGDLIHLVWTAGPIERTQEDFKKLPQIVKASAFLTKENV